MKKCVVIYTEGETDDEFYKKVLNIILNEIFSQKDYTTGGLKNQRKPWNILCWCPVVQTRQEHQTCGGWRKRRWNIRRIIFRAVSGR